MWTAGRYRVERQIGAGAFATVWLGYDDELDVPVAIKVLAENWGLNADVRRRFVDEARVLRRIPDPRIVRVHDIGTLPDGRSFFVMDYADAGTVADLVGRRPDLATAVAIAAEIARAVQVLHEHGVLHRDLKPSNLLLRHRSDGSEALMLADLGTAKALAEATGLTLTVGTPAYMAPEQAHGQHGLDERADVYGVAAVGYALATGHPPYADAAGVSDVAFREPDQRPDPLPAGGELASRLDQILREALAFDVEQRPRTAAALADQLDHLLAEAGSAEAGSAGVGPTGASEAGSDRHRAPLAGLRLFCLALVLMLVVACLTWWALALIG